MAFGSNGIDTECSQRREGIDYTRHEERERGGTRIHNKKGVLIVVSAIGVRVNVVWPNVGPLPVEAALRCAAVCVPSWLTWLAAIEVGRVMRTIRENMAEVCMCMCVLVVCE